MKLFVVPAAVVAAAVLASLAPSAAQAAPTADAPTTAALDARTAPDPSRYVAAPDAAAAERLLDGLAAGRVAAAGVQYGPCVLYPSPIRIRTDGKVGTKPHTKCSVPVTSIHHSTDMRYKSFIWWRLKGTKTASNRGQAGLQQKNVGFSCASDEQSGWGSTTLGTIVYGGKTYYARVYPARVSLACGG
ncbi:MAG: hypothetical protein ACTHLJ_00415 [Angustibacter sp.]